MSTHDHTWCAIILGVVIFNTTYKINIYDISFASPIETNHIYHPAQFEFALLYYL